jgi:quercetin dioxygenase-like cupin family protein
MKRSALFLAGALWMIFCAPVSAQAPVVPKEAPAVPTEDPGVARAVLIDRPELRVLRVEIQPGATRRIHRHDDLRYHLFLPLTSGVELTIGSAQPVAAAAGQAFFIKGGTPHSFRNTGASVAMAFEVFIKPDTAAATPHTADLAGRAWAAILPH